MSRNAIQLQKVLSPELIPLDGLYGIYDQVKFN